jgi:hypothetical protein
LFIISPAVVDRATRGRAGEHKHRATGTQEPPAETFADAAGVHVQNAHAHRFVPSSILGRLTAMS